MKTSQHKVEATNSSVQPSSKITLVMFVTLLLALMVMTGFMVHSYLLAIVIGGLFALLSYPLYRRVMRRGVGPTLAAVLVTSAIILLVLIPVLLLIYLAVEQGLAIANVLANNEEYSLRSLFERLGSVSFVDDIFGSHAAAKKKMYEALQGLGAATISATLSIAANMPNLVLQLALAVISFFFMLIDGRRFISWLKDKIPLDADVQKKIGRSFNDTAVSTIWAILAAAFVQAVIMFVAFLVLGVPAIFLAGAATFILAWIPLIGSTPVWLVGTLFLVQQDLYFKAVLMIAFGIVTGLSDNLVRPMVLRGKSNMHPLVSLVAIFGGIGMFGFFGVFVGPIIAAVFISLLQIWPLIGERFGFMECKTKNSDE